MIANAMKNLIWKMEIAAKLLEEKISQLKTTKALDENELWPIFQATQWLIDTLKPYEFISEENRLLITFPDRQISIIKYIIDNIFVSYPKFLNTTFIDNLIKELLFQSLLNFNRVYEIQDLQVDLQELVFPFDEIKILDLKNNKILYSASIRRQINILALEEFVPIKENINWLSIGEMSVMRDQIWHHPDFLIKLTNEEILIINCSVYSLQELEMLWNVIWLLKCLHQYNTTFRKIDLKHLR